VCVACFLATCECAEGVTVDAAKDRILLEGEQGGEDEDMDDEEVFALEGLATDADEDEDEDDDGDDAMKTAPAPSARPSRKSKAAKARAARADSSSEREDADEDEDEGWGTKKAAYYASNADDLASDDEEANAMEEDEARRLQSKARSALTDDAFGLADAPVAASGAEDDFDEYA
jgi:U3 small nucleolar RNA-associated protein 3